MRKRVVIDLLPLWLFNGREWWVVASWNLQSLLFGCLALFIKLHIDCGHLAVHLFFLLELLTAFILLKLGLSARRAIYSDSDVTLIFWMHFIVAFLGQARAHWNDFEARRQYDRVEICGLVHSNVTVVPCHLMLFLWYSVLCHSGTFSLKAWEKRVCRTTASVFLTRGIWLRSPRLFRFLVRFESPTAVLSSFDISSVTRNNLSWRFLTHIGSSLTPVLLIVGTVASQVWWQLRIVSMKRSFICLGRLAAISDVCQTAFHLFLLTYASEVADLTEFWRKIICIDTHF